VRSTSALARPSVRTSRDPIATDKNAAARRLDSCDVPPNGEHCQPAPTTRTGPRLRAPSRTHPRRRGLIRAYPGSTGEVDVQIWSSLGRTSARPWPWRWAPGTGRGRPSQSTASDVEAERSRRASVVVGRRLNPGKHSLTWANAFARPLDAVGDHRSWPDFLRTISGPRLRSMTSPGLLVVVKSAGDLGWGQSSTSRRRPALARAGRGQTPLDR